MILNSHDLIVLDTSVVVHVARDNQIGRAILQRYQLHRRDERPLMSSVTKGEIGALARWWGWGAGRLGRLQEILNELTMVSAGLPEVINSYSEIKAYSLKIGRPMGQNDMWIAATCVASGAELITTDTDFDWLHPHMIIRHYIQQP